MFDISVNFVFYRNITSRVLCSILSVLQIYRCCYLKSTHDLIECIALQQHLSVSLTFSNREEILAETKYPIDSNLAK